MVQKSSSHFITLNVLSHLRSKFDENVFSALQSNFKRRCTIVLSAELNFHKDAPRGVLKTSKIEPQERAFYR